MTTKPFDYTSAMAELQALLGDMQGDSLDVDDALKKYERGQVLIAQLSKYLDEAENNITVRKVE